MPAEHAPARGLRLIADLPDSEHDPDEVRRRADEVLSRREYRWGDSDDAGLVERILGWLDDRFGDLFGASGGGTLPRLVSWIVLGLLVGGAVLLVVRAVRARRGRSPGTDGSPRVVVAADEVGVDWAAEAARAVAEGRWRDALRCRYRVLVVDLAAAGLLGDLAGRTSGELAAELAASRPAASPAFGAATRLFEESWYGGVPAGADRLDDLERHASEARA